MKCQLDDFVRMKKVSLMQNGNPKQVKENEKRTAKNTRRENKKWRNEKQRPVFQIFDDIPLLYSIK